MNNGDDRNIQCPNKLTFVQWYSNVYTIDSLYRTYLERYFKALSECCSFLRLQLEIESLMDYTHSTATISPQTFFGLEMLITLICEVFFAFVNFFSCF